MGFNAPLHPDYSAFRDSVSAIIRPFSGKMDLHFLMGDLGEGITYFHAKFPDRKITVSGCGLGDKEQDAVLKISVDAFSPVEYSLAGLSEKKFPSLDEYSLNYWQEWLMQHPQSDPGFFSRAFNRLMSREFGLGLLAGVLLMLVVRSAARSRKKKI